MDRVLHIVIKNKIKYNTKKIKIQNKIQYKIK